MDDVNIMYEEILTFKAQQTHVEQTDATNCNRPYLKGAYKKPWYVHARIQRENRGLSPSTLDKNTNL